MKIVFLLYQYFRTGGSLSTASVTAQGMLHVCTESSEPLLAPDRRQSKTLSTIDERGSKINRISFFDCHLSLVWRQMTFEITDSIDF